MSDPLSPPPPAPIVLKRGEQHAIPAAEVGTSLPDAFASLRTYLYVLASRRWTILTVTCVLTTAVAIVSFKTRPVYRATSRIEVEADVPQIQSLSEPYRTIPSDDAFLQTQVDVIESDRLAWETITQLRLGESPDFGPDATPADPGRPEAWVSKRAQLLRTLKRRLQVELMRNSRMLEINFESTDPELAARVANALVSNYVEYNFRKKYDATRQASGWMERQLDELKDRVEKSQQALVDYERQNAIVNIDDKQNIVEQKLAYLNKELTQAQGDRVQKESLYQMVRSSESQVAFITRSELLGRLEEKYADLQSQYVDALAQYGPKFPKVLRLRAQANEIQGFIDRERKRAVQQIRGEYAAAVAREKLLSDAVAKEKTEVGKLNQLLIQHNLLKREFETNQHLYDNLLQRLKEATVSAGLKATNIHVVDAAVAPTVPVHPKKMLNIGIAFALGLLLGFVLAFVQEALNNSIAGSEDVERLTASPTLAVIPAANGARPRGYLPAVRAERKPDANVEVALTVVRDPDSLLAESYRKLRTSILLSTAPRPPQVILVTSTQPFEGKTCTSLNLALTLSQRGTETLIIDADLRKPGIGPSLGVANDGGLSSILTGAQGLEESLHRVDGMPGLSVLPAGPRPPNPAELLSSPAMEALLRALRQRFEYLVLDSPPLQPVTDATVLSAFVDGVVLVVECGVTDRGALARAHRMLSNAGARILGTVLNKTDLDHDGYYSSYYRAYYDSYFKGTG